MTENDKKFQLEGELELRNEFSIPTYDEWKKAVENELKGADFQKKMFTKTYEGITLKPIYTKEDLENLNSIEAYPSFANCVRGNKASGYVKNSWLISQHINSTDPNFINEIIKNDLLKGANSINITIENPERLSLQDLKKIFKEIEIDKNHIFINTGLSNAYFAKLFVSFLDDKKSNLAEIKGGILADPITFLVNKGFLPNSKKTIFKELSNTLKYLKNQNENFKSICVSGLSFHNAGASAVQELAYILAAAVEYADNLQSEGAEAKSIFSSMFVSTGIGSNHFMEIAKIRALRILWANLLRAYKLNAGELPIFIHAETSKTNQTICDPHVNLLRATTEAFSAIVAGVDSLQINPFDELYESVNDFSRRLARNQHIILKEETHLDKVTDPAGGSYFIESLTNEIASASWKEFQEIQTNGGLIESLKKNLIQNKINEIVQSKTKDVKTRKSIIVGTNMYANPKEENIEPKAKQIKSREITDINNLSELTELKITPLKEFRPAILFEEFRVKTEKYLNTNGFRPKVFLFNMGTLKQYKPRADFSRAFFELGGFEIIYNQGFDSNEAAVDEFNKSGADVAVICSADENYPELVPKILSLINKEKVITVLAGYPKEQIEMHKQNGINEFIYIGCDAYETLNRIFIKIEENKF